MQNDDRTRRAVLKAGGAAAAFMALADGATAAAALANNGTTDPAAEQANDGVVRQMIADYCVKGFDPADLVKKYMADDVVAKFTDSLPATEGAAAVTTLWRSFHAHGEYTATKILSSYAKGPVVVIHRIDTSMAPGKPSRDFEVVGVFVLKDKKIKEWRDYYLTWPV